MGVVKKQAFQNSIIQYLGILLGYLNVVVLFPKVLNSDQFGLTRIFFAIASLYVTFGALGSFKIVVKFFPFFHRHFRQKNSIFIVAFGISLIGFAIITALFIAFKTPILNNYSEKSELFVSNFYLLIPLSLLMMLFQLFESFLAAIKRTVNSNFLKNIVVRIIYLIDIGLYYFGWINFDIFFLIFIYTYGLVMLILFVEVLITEEITFSLKTVKVPKRVFRIIRSYGLFTIITGISNLLVNRIDIIMITFMIGLSDTAVYSMASYISSVIMVPMYAISRIASPVVSHDWKAKRLDKILELYKQSSISQLILGGWIFVCIWINMDDIFTFFPREYSNGKYVVLFIGLSVLYNMMTGINNTIMVVTKFYRIDTYASIGLAVVTILTNWLLIPEFGISGAAMATFFSIFLYNTFKYVVIYVKLKMQPYTAKTVVVIFLLLVFGYMGSQLPSIENHFFYSIVYKSVVFSVLFFLAVYFSRSFKELNEEVDKYLGKLRR